MPSTQIKQPLALYIHWPYCISKCPYCAFNSIVINTLSNESELWYQNVLKELNFEHRRLPNKYLTSIYFGGGTPSLMDTKYIASLIELSARYWPPDNPIEVTLEANPATLDINKLKTLFAIGINRLSIGVQSFNDSVLRFLGREHDTRQALEVINNAIKAGFANLSIDLIFATPKHTYSILKNDLKTAIATQITHISAYQLTIEEGTPFYHDYTLGKLKYPTEAKLIKQFNLVSEIMNGAGYYRYEISNFSKPGYRSIHNQAYWKYQEYLGLGPSSHSRLNLTDTIYAVERESDLISWHNSKTGILQEAPLDSTEILKEMFIVGLRTTTGVDLCTLKNRTGNDLTDKLLNSEQVKHLLSQNLLQVKENYLFIPETHLLKADAIIKNILKL